MRAVSSGSSWGRLVRPSFVACVAATVVVLSLPGAAAADATNYDCYIENYDLNFEGSMTGGATAQCAYGGDGSLRPTTFAINGPPQGGSNENFPISGTVTITDGVHSPVTESFSGTVERWRTSSGAELWDTAPGSYACDNNTNFGTKCGNDYWAYDSGGGTFRGTNESTVQPPALCAKVASPGGSDSNSGTLAAPFRTAERLWRALKPMQTGCLRGGTYDLTKDMFIDTAHIRLMSYQGERATIRGRIVLHADGVTLESLNLNGNCPAYACSYENPVINKIDDRLINNDITDDHKGICVMVDTHNGSTPARFLIQGNRIHNCGQLPANNHHHGIYVDTGYGGTIRDNVIYDNADRGIQLFPDAYENDIFGNTIDGNGQGIITSIRSTANRWYDNVITNSNVRFNVETDRLTGVANLVTFNCLWATHPDPWYRQNGGVQPGNGPPEIVIAGNTVADPGYVNRQGKDFRIPASSPCFGRGASDAVARP